jgi:putative ABC transport system ATP-binding protein
MLLEINNLLKKYDGPAGPVTALEDVSFSLDAGQFLAVKGPSGCGKSTLLLTVGGLLRPDAGTVRIAGTEPYALSADKRADFRARQIGFVFQQFHLVPYLSVLDNVLAPTLAIGSNNGRDHALQLLDQFGMSSRSGHRPGELSSGERQRTALARALLNRPQVLLADEPTGNLDEENSQIVLQALKQFAESGGGVLLVTHEQAALGYADEVLPMRAGRLEATSPAAEEAPADQPST